MSDTSEVKGVLEVGDVLYSPITRAISVERTYALAQYQNIKLHDTVNDLPEEALSNRELITAIRYLQLLQLELDYRQYVKLMETLSQYDIASAIQFLETEKVNTIDLIRDIFNKEEK